MRTFDRKPRKSRNEVSERRRAGDPQPKPMEDELAESLNRRPAVVSQLQIQRALNLDEPGDPHEREAERVAGKVARKISEGGTVAPAIEESIRQQEGGGQQLAAPVRQSMEHEFGADFRDVEVHADAQADRLSRALDARAFTTGRDIFFKKGEYQPENRDGQELIAHELTHVVQQDGGTQTVNRQLDDLPPEVTSHIASYLDPASLGSFLQTSTTNLAIGAEHSDPANLYERYRLNGIQSPVIQNLPPQSINRLANYVRENRWRNHDHVGALIDNALWEHGLSLEDYGDQADALIADCVNSLGLGCVDLSYTAGNLQDLEIVMWGLTHVPDQQEVDFWVARNLPGPGPADEVVGMDTDQEIPDLVD